MFSILKTLWRGAYSTIFWCFIMITSFLLFPIAVVIYLATVLFDKRRVVLHQFTCFWASLYTWFNPLWDVTVVGIENMRSDQAYVCVANHLSTLDILIMHRLFRHFKWVSKIENFRVPFIGWNMQLNKYIAVRRGDKSSVVQMFKACDEALSGGSSIMMFPEGTRSSSGRLRQFKPGAFEIALSTKKPILPIVIRGTADALPKSGFILQGKHTITIEVKRPLPYTEFKDLRPEELTLKMRTYFANELGEADPQEASDAGMCSPKNGVARW